LSLVVVDASLILAIIAGDDRSPQLLDRIASHEMHAPHFIDLEVIQTVRKTVLHKHATLTAANASLATFARLPILKHAHSPLLERIWELRDNFSAYDATYVALAELLGVPLLTRDARMSRATGHRVPIEFVE
jgi:predicted nucleic acid-binding protein